MAIKVEKFTFNGFQENTYVIHDGEVCVIIDPGCYERHEQSELSDFISSNNLSPAAVLMTHSHIDHALGLDYVLKTYSVDFYQHTIDVETLSSIPSYAHVYGFPGYSAPSRSATHLLSGGETLTFGEMTFEVLFTPGHAPGHVIFHDKLNNYVINGDVLFKGSFGRVDLPGGSMEVLKKTIIETMFELPEETIIYCGHGPETTIGEEKRTNFILTQ